MGEKTDLARGNRLVAIRGYLGLTPTDMAAEIRVGYTTWKNYEHGFPLPIETGRRIRARVPGMTLDWIYEADASKLPQDLQIALGALPAPSQGKPRPKNPR